MLIGMMIVTSANADWKEPVKYGAIMTGLGLIIGNNTDLNRDIVAPVMGVVGVDVGLEKDRKKRHKKVRQAEEAVRLQAQRKAQVTNYHPGISIIKIPISNSNGVDTDIRIMRVKGKFVGPQGEEYKTLPTSTQLQKKYGM